MSFLTFLRVVTASVDALFDGVDRELDTDLLFAGRVEQDFEDFHLGKALLHHVLSQEIHQLEIVQLQDLLLLVHYHSS